MRQELALVLLLVLLLLLLLLLVLDMTTRQRHGTPPNTYLPCPDVLFREAM